MIDDKTDGQIIDKQKYNRQLDKISKSQIDNRLIDT